MSWATLIGASKKRMSPRIQNQLAWHTVDPEFHVACIRAYNDWISDYAGYAPDRLWGVAYIPNVGADIAIAELHRVLEMPGIRGVLIGQWPEGGLEIAKRSRGTPRVSNRLLRRVRDFAQVRAQGSISREVADAALKMLDVDVLGLDVMDRKLLSAVIEKFSGGPVGLENLAHAIGEEADTIEDVLEPYLIQQGYLQRTPRGRIATVSAYRHLGLTAPKRSDSGALFGQ